MNEQDRFVFVLNTAADVVKSAQRGLEDIWAVRHAECLHFLESTCTMNSENIRVLNSKGSVDCTFEGCPYTS